MTDWRHRLIIEESTLNERIEALEAFRGTNVYRDLPGTDQDLLTMQLLAMRSYIYALRARMKRTPPL